MKSYFRWLAIFAVGVVMVSAFQNCNKASFEKIEDLSSQGDPSGDDPGNPKDGEDAPPGYDPAVPGTINKVKTYEFNPVNRKVDIVLMFDTSGSMETDGKKLASKLSGFATKLASMNFDWQMCYVNAEPSVQTKSWVLPNGAADGILRPGYTATQLQSIFTATINKLYERVGDGNEQGVGSLNKHIEGNSTHHCYRPGATIAAIIISDEDEMSGRYNQGYYAASYPNVSLYAESEPGNYLAKLKSMQQFLDGGRTSPVIANSIVILSSEKPAGGGVSACLNSQGNELYNGQTMFWLNQTSYGKNYEDLSQLTGGLLASICAPDYGPILDNVAVKIDAASFSMKLDCMPISEPKIATNPVGTNLSVTRSGDTLYFKSTSQTAFGIQVNYVCNK